ncbi:hypothetical protein K7711_16630 [Nocardia sp. CA2R105]|uniref:hypothetical protein n=1 Tax=Nocardia coffeae TaxID=2873381 RepID=UPI001CA6DC84|nr:hypothetical protein [Nocardia coffeae]MBY8858112.1 hypothetical protein [Nocardia coffeae]
MIRKMMAGAVLVVGLASMGAGTAWADDPPPPTTPLTQPGVLPPPPGTPPVHGPCQPGVIGC